MLKKLFEDHQLYHSEFQQDYFITVRGGGTEYGMYKQALRELHKRYRGLKELYSEKELIQVDIDELAERKVKDKYEKRRNEIKHAQKIMAMEDMDKNIEDTEREFKRFYQQAISLKEKIGDLTDIKRNALDKDMWIYKAKEMAAIDFVTSGRITKGTYELISAMPKEMRKDVLVQITNHNELLNWYENKEDVDLELPEVDVKKMLGDKK